MSTSRPTSRQKAGKVAFDATARAMKRAGLRFKIAQLKREKRRVPRNYGFAVFRHGGDPDGELYEKFKQVASRLERRIEFTQMEIWALKTCTKLRCVDANSECDVKSTSTSTSKRKAGVDFAVVVPLPPLPPRQTLEERTQAALCPEFVPTPTNTQNCSNTIPQTHYVTAF
jgi:hypothetical protein